MKAHGSQLAPPGSPYFSHPVKVAGHLCRGMKLDCASIITGLLHDTVEDTLATLGDIEKLFGAEIARLVDGVTKLSRLELQSDQTKQAENFRKLVLTDVEDIQIATGEARGPAAQYAYVRFIRCGTRRRRKPSRVRRWRSTRRSPSASACVRRRTSSKIWPLASSIPTRARASGRGSPF